MSVLVLPTRFRSGKEKDSVGLMTEEFVAAVSVTEAIWPQQVGQGLVGGLLEGRGEGDWVRGCWS